MKIYFTASFTGLNQYGENYKKICETLRSLGHEVYDDLINEAIHQTRSEDNLQERRKIHQKIMNYVGKSDIVVAETSYPSTNVGYEISSAIEKSKPVLILHVEGKSPMLLLGRESDNIEVVEYSLDDLKSTLKAYVEELKEQMDVRFNFFVSPRIVQFLDWVAKKKKMPRAVYLRRLIEADMQKNRDFEKE